MNRAKKAKGRKAPTLATRPLHPRLYELSVLPEIEKAIGGIRDVKLKKRIADRIDDLAKDPRGAGCKAIGNGLTRVRVGDWRIVYRVVDETVVVCILRVAERDEVYRDLATLAKALRERAAGWKR